MNLSLERTIHNRSMTQALVCGVMVAWALASLSGYAVRQLDAGSIVWIKLLIVAPIIEESFFRLVVQDGLRRRRDWLGHPQVANALTAVAFASTHMWLGSGLHALAVLGPIWVIGWAYARWGSVRACIALHMGFNALWILWMT